MTNFIEVTKQYAKEHTLDNLYALHMCGRTCVLTPLDELSISEMTEYLRDPETGIMKLREVEEGGYVCTKPGDYGDIFLFDGHSLTPRTKVELRFVAALADILLKNIKEV